MSQAATPAEDAEAAKLAEIQFPPVSRVWTGEDYEKAAAMIGQGKVPLPRFSTIQGLVILKRLTSQENLAVLQRQDVPLVERQRQQRKISAASHGLFGQYARAATAGEKVGEEITHVTVWLMNGTAAAMRLLREVEMVSPDHARKRVAEEYSHLEGQASELLLGAVEMLDDDGQQFTASDKSFLIRGMGEGIKLLSPLLTPGKKAEIAAAMSQRIPGFEGQDFENLKAMLHRLQPGE